MVDAVYWWSLSPVLLLGALLGSPLLPGSAAGGWLWEVREEANQWAEEVFTQFDMADNADTIAAFGFAHLLHSATRLGRQAHFLARKRQQQRRQQRKAHPAALYKGSSSSGSGSALSPRAAAGQEGAPPPPVMTVMVVEASVVEGLFQRALRRDPNHAQNLVWSVRQAGSHTQPPPTPYDL